MLAVTQLPSESRRNSGPSTRTGAIRARAIAPTGLSVRVTRPLPVLNVRTSNTSDPYARKWCRYDRHRLHGQAPCNRLSSYGRPFCSELRVDLTDISLRGHEQHSSDTGLHGTAMRTTENIGAYRARPASSDSPNTGPRCDLANWPPVLSIQAVTSGVPIWNTVRQLVQDQASWYREAPELASAAGEPRHPVMLQRASQ